MKIGILTFQQSHFGYVQKHNYGAVIQAYALKEAIKTIDGVELVEVIDYKPAIDNDIKYKRYFYRVRDAKSFTLKIKTFILLILLFPKTYARRRGFKKFFKSKMDLSGKKYGPIIFDDNYDAYIFGSDQIWNKGILGGFDSTFFGDFKTKSNTRKISYAASGAIRELDNTDKLFFKDKLSNLNSISVREETFEALLQPLYFKKIQTVLDPTLLADKIILTKIARKPKIKQKYILLYLLGGIDKTILETAKTIAKLNNTKLITISFLSDNWKPQANLIQNASPQELLGWFLNSEYILTNSFHGTAFSVVFNKDFLSFLSGSPRDERILNLLEKLQIKSRGILTFDEALEQTKEIINWGNVNILLDTEREKSFNFIKNALFQN